MSAVGVMMTFALVGCGDGAESDSQMRDSAVSAAQQDAGSSSSKENESGEDSSTDSNDSASSTSSGKTSDAKKLSDSSASTNATEITPVDPADYTPPDSATTRLFKLEDDQTKCFLNDLSGDVYLSCAAPITDPPMVDDGNGNKVPANAVSWHPGGVNYDSLIFPPVDSIKILPPHASLSSFGYTCTAYGPATLECAGPAGRATIDAGKVIGAQLPTPAAPGIGGQGSQQRGSGGEQGKSDSDGGPAGPQVPAAPLMPGLRHLGGEARGAN